MENLATHHSAKKQEKLDFDCGTEFGDTFLDRNLISRPDLNNEPIDVLIRFRLEEMGFTSDTKTNFYQVGISVEQRSFMKILWWENRVLIKRIVKKRKVRAHIWVSIVPTLQ